MVRNLIRYNETGIESISANPYISQNKIESNLKNGIVTRTSENFHQFGIILKNQIIGNTWNGIFCEGDYNRTKIKGNTYIGLNHKAGICVGAGSYLNISENTIS